MGKQKIVKKTFSNEMKSNCYNYYNTIKEAAASIDTKMDSWKVQMLIVDAINNKKVAFKSRWYIEDNN